MDGLQRIRSEIECALLKDGDFSCQLHYDTNSVQAGYFRIPRQPSRKHGTIPFGGSSTLQRAQFEEWAIDCVKIARQRGIKLATEAGTSPTVVWLEHLGSQEREENSRCRFYVALSPRPQGVPPSGPDDVGVPEENPGNFLTIQRVLRQTCDAIDTLLKITPAAGGNSDPPRREVGPVESGLFVHNGIEHEVERIPWLVIDFMWEKMKAPESELCMHVWGVSTKPETAVKSAVHGANEAMTKADCNRGTIRRKKGDVYWRKFLTKSNKLLGGC